MGWEYKVVELDYKTNGFIKQKLDGQIIENQLNELGRNNWEMVSFTPPAVTGFSKQVCTAVFKRHK